MKTAIQELMTEIEQNYRDLFNVNTEKGRNFINQMHKYLVLEKEQIIDAHNAGQAKEASDSFWSKGELYYDETYG